MTKKESINLKKDKVFYISAVMLVGMIALLLSNLEKYSVMISDLVKSISQTFGGFYIGLFGVFLIFCVYLGCSKYRKIRLGKNDERPRYSFLSWFSMLFSAGMGIGLVFWGVAEPLTHYVMPHELEGMTEQAKQFALNKSFLHWGVSAWACYATLAVVLAYFQFRKDKPMLMSRILEPFIGERLTYGKFGMSIDVFTVIATIAGVVSSLGLGTLQINAGLNYLFGIPTNTWVQMLIITIITIAFLSSALAGLNSGIQKVSNMNLIIAFTLLVVAIVLGPTYKMFQNLIQGLGGYGGELIRNMDVSVQGDWYGKWTIYYWSTWICWAPPVAIFIARISRGRTIKEFIAGVLLVPSIVCIIWMTVFGTMAFEVSPEVAQQAVLLPQTALFRVFQDYPMPGLISMVAIILIGTFFVTSADSATFVLGMLTTNGDINPPKMKKFVLGLSISVLTIIFLIAGGLNMIQNVAILAAFPFGFVMIGCMIAFIKVLRTEQCELKQKAPVKEIKATAKQGVSREQKREKSRGYDIANS